MRRAALLMLLLGVGCEDYAPPPSVPPLYVSAQLVVGDSIQYIFVDRPRSPEEPRGEGFNDAMVVVSDGDSTYTYTPIYTSIRVMAFGDTSTKEDSVWLYVAHFSPRPKTTYSLTVIRGGDTATGTTTTPDVFPLLLLRFNFEDSSVSPVDTVRLPQDSTVLAVWRPVEGAAYYYAFVYNYDKRDSLTLFRPPRYLFVAVPDTALFPGAPDSLRVFPPFAYYEAPAFAWGDGNHAVKVWALNEDRYRWGILDEGNLNNAAGFFAAVSQSVVITPVKFTSP
ncbi:MAG: DUF4249 family protein [Thermotogae bacterium]|nr:DUF4249 family protein [Thermotogota bacterium]